MQNQFKPGDLALVIGSSRGVSPNIGLAVELVCRIPSDGAHMTSGGKRLINRGPDCWVVTAESVVAGLHAGGWVDVGGLALVLDQHLMPLKGTETPQLEKQKEVEHG